MSRLESSPGGVRKAGYTCWEYGGTDACAVKSMGHNLDEVGHLYNL